MKLLILKKIKLFGLRNNDFSILLIYLLMGLVWSTSSPISSSADDDYHLVSIWCADLKSGYCIKKNDERVLVPNELNAGLIPKNFTGLPPCYVSWPIYQQSAECIKNIKSGMTESTRFSKNNNSKIYYLFHSKFVSSNIILSIYIMRWINVAISFFLFSIALLILDKKINRVFTITWIITIIPIGIFYIASNNPSSWALSGIATFWAYMLNIVKYYISNKKIQPILFFAMLMSICISLFARNDSIIYISIIMLIILIIYSKELFNKFKNDVRLKNVLLLIFSIALILYSGYKFILSKYNFNNLSFPKADLVTNSPNAILNLLIEMPSFFIGLVGGQQPIWNQSFGVLGRNFTYGAGWLEFSFPDITGIFIGTAITFLTLSSIKNSSKLKLIGLLFGIISLTTCMILDRGSWKFLEGSYFQPRYILPFAIALIGLTLYNETNNLLLVGRKVGFLLSFLVFFGQISAWLQLFSRYNLGPEYPYTNIETISLWWHFSNENSKILFIYFSVVIHSLWAIKLNFYLNRKDKECLNESLAKH